MKKYLLIVSCVLIYALGYSQDDIKPDMLRQTLTEANDSTYADVALVPKGVFKTVRVQAGATQSQAKWVFFDADPNDFIPKWSRDTADLIMVNQFNDDYALYKINHSGADGRVNITAGKYYTFNIQDIEANADLAILETDFLPQSINSVYQTPNKSLVYTNQ